MANPADSGNANIQIRQADLTGDCTRLNRVLGMLWQKVGSAVGGSTIQNVTNISGGGGGSPSGNVRVSY